MTKTPILTMAALGLLALTAMTPTTQAACIGIGVDLENRACVGVDTGMLPPAVEQKLDEAAVIAGDARDDAIAIVDSLPGAPTTPDCLNQPPFILPGACAEWTIEFVTTRIGPLTHWASGEGEGTMRGWVALVGPHAADLSTWGGDSSALLADYAGEDVADPAADFAVGEAFGVSGFGLGRATAASSLAATQATYLAQWFDAAQGEVAAYAQRESNGRAAHERAYLAAVDAFLQTAADNLRTYALAEEAYQICLLGHPASECGPRPTPVLPTVNDVPQHQDYVPGPDPVIGQPQQVDAMSLYAEYTPGEYDIPGGPGSLDPRPETPLPPEPPIF